MNNDSKLLVPMYLEALLLRNDKKDCLDLSPALQKLYDEESFLGDALEADLKSKITLERGIHLHWTLPKALKHAFVDQEKEMKFPLVPNRWMVLRIQTDQGIQAMPSKMWLVESDSPADENTKTNLVLIKDDKFEFKNIGKKIDWPNTPSNNSEVELTAVSAANPFFASFYPGCKNVFGFHDDLKDVPSECFLTYIVTGWYSDASNDPLAPLNFSGEAQTKEQKQRKKERDWFMHQWKCNVDEYPSSCLLHASKHSIHWNPELQSGVPEGAVQVYAGNTAIESLSAQIIKSSGINQAGIEELLNALQYQLLEDDKNQPSLDSLKSDIHKRGFTPKDRGGMWEVTRRETTDKDLEDKETKPQFPNNIDLLHDLKKLNATQIKANGIEQEILSLQQEYYFLWYKQANKTINNYTLKDFNYEGARKKIYDPEVPEGSQLGQLLDQYNTLKNEIALSKTNLEKYDELAKADSEFELKEKVEDRFWEPNEPVLLLCGDGVGNTKQTHFQTADKEVNCRVIEQLYSDLELLVPHPNSAIPVSISTASFAVPKIDSLSSTEIPFEAIKALSYETLLFDQVLSLDIALLAYKAANLGEGKDKTSAIVKDFAEKTVFSLQESILENGVDTDAVAGSIQAPAVYSISKWQQAWVPLFMLWEVQYSPSEEEIKNLNLLEAHNKWKLEDGLFFKNQSTKAEHLHATFQGLSPFSNAVYANLKRLIPDEIVNKYGDLNLIAQTLSGLHKFLLMQRPDIQLPPLKYKPDEDFNFESSYSIDEAELNIIGPEAYRLGCDPGIIDGSEPNLFYPLRSGLIQVVNLSIVDVFGQVKKVIVEEGTSNPEINCSVSIKGLDTTEKNLIPLPPRIIQPSRLQFHWLNNKDEVIYQDAGELDNPIFAWLIPNYLDNSIMVYDGEGNEVAILQITTDISKDKGLYLSKIPFPGSFDFPDLSDNPYLTDLLESMDKGSIAAGIMDLASKVNLNLSGINSIQNNTSAMLCGQALGLARCTVGLELLGLPTYNQRWDESGKENTGDIESIQVPLFIGNFNHENDGLLGYFKEADYSQLYTTINAPEFKFSESETFFKSDTPVKLSLNQGNVKLTLLLDPSAGVHLSSAILPTKMVELFAYHSNKLLSTLNTSFMVAPFIAEKVEPGIPIPTSIDANWKWTHKSDVTTWKKEEIEEGKNKQLSNFKKQQLYEGWLKLSNLKTNAP